MSLVFHSSKKNTKALLKPNFFKQKAGEKLGKKKFYVMPVMDENVL